jgi:hypothetical protein
MLTFWAVVSFSLDTFLFGDSSEMGIGVFLASCRSLNFESLETSVEMLCFDDGLVVFTGEGVATSFSISYCL